MKKIFLFAAAILVAVTANAFSLRFQNSDLEKNEQIVSATDIDDVLGDGKVAVHFDSEKKTITVTLDGATLKGTNANPVFEFIGDASYTRLELKIKGQCAINATGTSGNAIRLESGALVVTAVDPSSAKLDISGNSTVIHLQNDASLMIGDLAGDSFDVNITGAANQVVFYGAGSGNQWLVFALANIFIKAEETTELAADLDMLTVSGKISNGVVVEGNTFKKGGEIYKGNLDIYAPYLIMVGTTSMYPGEEESFAPSGLGSGSIKYDKSSKTLTLEGVEITQRLWIGYDDFTIYLKGNNSFENPGNTTEERIMFAGENGKITGDASAELIINGAGYSKGIYAIEGLEIGEFNGLTIQNTTIGISGAAGSEEEGNVLKITSTPMPQVIGTEAAIKNFKGLTITSNELAEVFASKYQYSTSEQAVVDKDDNTEIKQSISLIYPVYFTFCDVEVTGRNAADIPVENVLSGKASYDKATATLTLNGFKNEAVTTTDGVANMTKDLNIKLIGENILGASVAIETSYNLIVEGPGSLQINGGDNTAAIQLATSSELTIKNGASVEVNGYAGIKSDATIDCMEMGMDPGDAEPSSNDAAVLTINNASLHVKSTDEGAVFGFREANLTDAKVEEADVEFVFDCLEGSSSPATFGFYSNTLSDYAKEVTIVKTGATAVENIQTQPASDSKKVIENGQVVILREGKRYNLLGAEMK